MPAPRGNQYAIDNQGGRPPKYDLTKEAQDLNEWSKTPDSQCLYQFTYYKPYLAAQLTEFAQQNEEFSLALKKAKERIAVHRENACSQGKLHHRIWNRSARLYDHMLKEQEDTDKDTDIERNLKVAAAQPVNPFLQKLLEIDGKTADLVENAKFGCTEFSNNP